MAANPSIQLGTDGNWAIKEDNLLAYKKDGTRFFNKEFDFSRGTTATFIGEDGLIQESAIDVPRIDFSDSTNGALLLEPSRTNLLPYSEDFTQSNWLNIGNPTITSNYGASPDGTLNSTRVQFASSSNSLYDPIPHTIGDTASIYVKGISGETIQFGAGVNVGVGQLFTLNGDWQRIKFQSTGNVVFCIGTYQSATARDIEVYGAQLEQGSYATSYIPTYGSAVTRNAEVCNNSGSAQDFNDSEGVLYAEISALADDGTYRIISLSNSTFVERIYMQYTNASNTVSVVVKNGSVTQANIGFVLPNETDFNKIAFKYKSNDFALWVNGFEVGTDTSGSTPIGLSELAFDSGAGNNPFYGNVKCVAVFKEALSDTELQKLTTI
jgi:hypothetical protein